MFYDQRPGEAKHRLAFHPVLTGLRGLETEPPRSRRSDQPCPRSGSSSAHTPAAGVPVCCAHDVIGATGTARAHVHARRGQSGWSRFVANSKQRNRLALTGAPGRGATGWRKKKT